MNIPCPIKTICIDDVNALGNYSSEDPDQLLFRSTYWANQIWDRDFDIWKACYGLCVSTVSQAEADLCAQNNARICESNKLFGNVLRTYYRTCSDGNQYSVTIPGNTFYGFSQAEANALANNWADDYLTQLCDSIWSPTNPNPGPPPVLAFPPPDVGFVCNDEVSIEVPCPDGGKGITILDCKVMGSSKDAANEKARSWAQALLTNNVGCLIPFIRSACLGDGINQSVVPNRTGAFHPPTTWDIFGSVPPGIQFEPRGVSMRIFGTFNQAGEYIFRLTLYGASEIYSRVAETFTYRTYRISVMEITEPDVLPTGQQDESYSHAIDVSYGIEPRTFALQTGSSLPDGLTLNGDTGVISGIPSGYGTYQFTIVVADAADAVCDKEFTLNIDPNLFFGVPWVLAHVDTPPGFGYATGAGESIHIGAVVAGGLVINGGIASANFAIWICNNPTGRTLNCAGRLQVQIANNCEIPPFANGVQHAFADGYLWERTDIGPIVYFGGTTLHSGVYTWNFPIPPGITTWHAGFQTGGGVCGGAPYTGGSVDWQLALDIIT